MKTISHVLFEKKIHAVKGPFCSYMSIIVAFNPIDSYRKLSTINLRNWMLHIYVSYENIWYLFDTFTISIINFISRKFK